MTDIGKPDTPLHIESDGAPFVYFDVVSTNGTFNGVVQIDVASRIMIPLADGGVDVKFVSSGRLRCSVQTAMFLRDAVNNALEMLEKSKDKPNPAAASKLN